MKNGSCSLFSSKRLLLVVISWFVCFSMSFGNEPVVEFNNWPSVDLTAGVGTPNPRDVVLTADLVFPNIEDVRNWGEAKLIRDGLIEIALVLPGKFGVLPAVEQVRHTYVINQDPNTAYIALYDPTVTRRHLDLPDGDYTVLFKINGRVLASTEFTLGADIGNDHDVSAKFGYLIQYGSGVPVAALAGWLTFTLPPEYTLDEESLGNDDLDIRGYADGEDEVLPITYTGYTVLESYPEQVRLHYSIGAPDFLSGKLQPKSYTVKANPKSITFNNGLNAVKRGVVGRINISFGDLGSDRVEVRAEVYDLTQEQEGPHSIVVSYNHGTPTISPINAQSIGDNDILVFGFRDRALHYARFVRFFPTFAPGNVIAQYEIDGGSGKGWTATDNGAYSIHLAEDGVTLPDGSSLPPRLIGRFLVKIPSNEEPAPAPSTGPIVVAEAKPLMATPVEPERAIIPYTFRVLAIDTNGVNLESVEGMEISAYRHPGRPWDKLANNDAANLSEPIIATVRNVTPLIPEIGNFDGIYTVAQANCELIAPGGAWDANDNGHYVLQLKGGQVANLLGQSHQGGIIGYFSVLIYGPIANAAALDNGWCYSPTLGYFSEQTFPWFAHPDHGWWYAASGMNKDAIIQTITGDWFYDLKMADWLYHDADWYPFLFSGGRNDWLYFFEGSRAPRIFYQFRTEELVEIGE